MYFIFSFSYLSKENYSFLRNKMNSYQSEAKITLLTSNSFNSHFSSKFNNLKKILYGKYLLVHIQIESDINLIKDLIIKINEIVSFINSLNLELKILLTIYKDNVYFYDLLNKANNYNKKNTYDLLNNINKFNYYNTFIFTYLINNKFLSYANNLSILNNSNNCYISYLY